MRELRPEPQRRFERVRFTHLNMTGGWLAAAMLTTSMTLAGCGPQLMPTPNLYARSDQDPFADVPAELRTSQVDVLYVTDRLGVSKRTLEYTYHRSRSLGFGIVPVSFGRNVTWNELVQASRASFRIVGLAVKAGEPHEMGRFPPTPPRWVLDPAGELVDAPESLAQRAAAERAFTELLESRLAITPHKDVYLYIHGFNNTFEDSVATIGQIWHFLGRRGVPVAYSWPAGSGGLRGYAYDRESGEFTIFHLKQLLRLLGKSEQVGHVHIIAHSRGTEVAVSALRELYLQCGADAELARRELKLGTLVMAAPDIDLDVALQRLAAERLFRLPETTAVYVSQGDWALWLANWVFLGITRFGRLRPSDLPHEELEAIRLSGNIQLIDTYDASVGVLGHSNFYQSPAVSSDLILLLREGRPPGREHGRPLVQQPDGFWILERDYPSPN